MRGPHMLRQAQVCAHRKDGYECMHSSTIHGLQLTTENYRRDAWRIASCSAFRLQTSNCAQVTMIYVLSTDICGQLNVTCVQPPPRPRGS